MPRRISTTAVLAAVSVLAFGIGEAGRPTTLHAQAGREQTIYVSVVDKQGDPVTDLEAREIVVREDGAPREVLRVSRATEPIDIALLVDDSRAMEPQLLHFREALTRFVDQMHQNNNIAVIGLAARPTIFTDYTRNIGQLKSAIGRIFPQSDSGMTLLDALVETSRGLEKRETPRAVLLAVITDGPEYGHADDQQAGKAITKAGAAFYAVTVGTFSAIFPDELRYRLMVLANGTKSSGGVHDNILAATGLPQALEKVGRELSSQLKVVYSRPESLIQPESVEVRVTRPGLIARGTPARRAGAPR